MAQVQRSCRHSLHACVRTRKRYEGQGYPLHISTEQPQLGRGPPDLVQNMRAGSPATRSMLPRVLCSTDARPCVHRHEYASPWTSDMSNTCQLYGSISEPMALGPPTIRWTRCSCRRLLYRRRTRSFLTGIWEMTIRSYVTSLPIG